MTEGPEKNYVIGQLYDLYGELLPERQRDAVDLYYNDDLSLSEIAAECGITRQGVHDALKKAEEQLVFFEERLRLLEKQRKTDEALRFVIGGLEKLPAGEKDVSPLIARLKELL